MSALEFRGKIITWDALPTWRAEVRARRQTLVVTNGCFDLLHAGHVTYLEAARNLGNLLLVGLNSDASVRELKGPSRPVNPEQDRATVLAALQSVDAVCVFADRRAVSFLERSQPDIYVKGGEFNADTIPQEERRVVEAVGARIVFIPMVPGRSTTALLERLAQPGRP